MRHTSFRHRDSNSSFLLHGPGLSGRMQSQTLRHKQGEKLVEELLAAGFEYAHNMVAGHSLPSATVRPKASFALQQSSHRPEMRSPSAQLYIVTRILHPGSKAL